MEIEKLQELNNQRKYIEDLDNKMCELLTIVKDEDRDSLKKHLNELLDKEKDKFQKM
jgi:nitrogen regulatory protein PII-like uncharacterized protein